MGAAQYVSSPYPQRRVELNREEIAVVFGGGSKGLWSVGSVSSSADVRAWPAGKCMVSLLSGCNSIGFSVVEGGCERLFEWPLERQSR